MLTCLQLDPKVDCVEQDLNHILVFKSDQVWVTVFFGQIEDVLQVTSLQEPAQVVQVPVIETLVQSEDPFSLFEVFKWA